ncbi:hypothetical protein [Actinomadura roseirufa]|uniref:hypothetical protein n=1 Tax=Actinomadura roseirufa TaxID=2094049 RepID=UPI0010414697|nr:hypothetical protein [Actinomadura roseirufa]
MTTDPHDEHGEILRRALHAEADTVTPADDGLERIRARIADGGGRRHFLLDRFGPARFTMDRFSVAWARPVLAVAAAVAVAGIGVTAPRTIDLIQHSVGANGASGGPRDQADGDRSDPQGRPVSPGAPTVSGPSATGSPSETRPPRTSDSPGMSSCVVSPGATASASSRSPKGETAPPSSIPACPQESPTQKPTHATPTPTPTKPTEPTPTEQQPTPSTSSEPAITSDQSSGTP